MPKYAALFSGQGSQYPQMGKELYQNFIAVRNIYQCAGDILGFDVAKLSFEGSEEALAQTLNAQPVIFTHSMACFEAAKQSLPMPNAVAGHSLGEFAALCCAGAYALEDGFRIIKARSECMDRVKTPGAMYAAVGVDAATVDAACKKAGGFVLPVNFNLPNQTVLAGESGPAQTAAQILADQHGAKMVKLSVSSAFHTSMMQEAAQEFRERIASISFQSPAIDFYSNLTGGKLVVDDFPAYFSKHMVSPVQFVLQMQAMHNDGIETCVEFGPKKTVSTLAKKNVRAFSVGNVEDLDGISKAEKLFA